MSSANIQVWGAGGGSPNRPCGKGGGGGYAEGTLAVTSSQVLYVSAGEGGYVGYASPSPGPDGIGQTWWIHFFLRWWRRRWWYWFRWWWTSRSFKCCR